MLRNIDQLEFFLVVEIILKSIYVDDSMDLVFDVKIVIEFYNQLLEFLGFVGMYVRKWLFNELEVLWSILFLDCVIEVDFDCGELF